MRDTFEESKALLNERSSLDEDDQASHVTPRQLVRNSRWMVIASIVLVAIDALVSIFVLQKVSHLAAPQLAELEFRSQYVGLDELYSLGKINVSQYDPIINTPRVAAQVSWREPDKVFPDDEHRWLGSFGTVSPIDRHLFVTKDIHTILQFQVLDFGMERCALTLSLPPTEDGRFDDITLDIRKVDGTRQLDVQTLSWANRPKCKPGVQTIVSNPGGEVRLPEFPCKWGTIHTFEVSCGARNSDCKVDVWSNRDDPWGFFIYQFQTL